MVDAMYPCDLLLSNLIYFCFLLTSDSDIYSIKFRNILEWVAKSERIKTEELTTVLLQNMEALL